MMAPELVLAEGGEWWDIKGRDYSMYTALLPCTIQTPSELNGRIVRVGDKRYLVKGLELFMHNNPWREGEQCAFALVALETV